jgi:hypothetical protein
MRKASEHFQEKWNSVFRREMRHDKNTSAVSVATRWGTALAALAVIFVSVRMALAQAPAVAPTVGVVPMPPSPWFVYTVIIVVFVGALVALGLVRSAIEASNFSLGDALSEEAQTTVMEKDAAGHDTPRLGSDGKPVTMTVLVGSISRVIALLGTVALMVLFIGFGTFVMYYFATGQGAPKDIDKVVNFLIAGLTLFAPYIVNKFSSLFETLGRTR